MDDKYFIMHFPTLQNSILPMSMLDKIYDEEQSKERHPVVAQDLTRQEAEALNAILESLKENKRDSK